MRIHIVSLPHTQTTKDYSWCAYTAKVWKFCDMMMWLGHEVFLYSGEENTAPCTRHFAVISKEEQQKWFGHYDWSRDVFNGWNENAEWWQTMNRCARTAIQNYGHGTDFVGIIAGRAQAELMKIPQMMKVEWGIGYSGVLPGTFKCFESYAWQHHVAGLLKDDEAKFFDTVIPNSFLAEEFEVGPGGDDFGFLGRLMKRKGPQIAAETCKRIGAKLIMAGQGVQSKEPGRIVAMDGTVIEGDVSHIGVLGPAERSKFLGSLKALFVPTQYLEPFGGVAIEAMLCGTPVITTDWGAFTETVDRKSGFRCSTLKEFVEATANVGHLDRNAVQLHAQRYLTDRVRFEYDRWFKRLETLRAEGWYTP